MSDRTPADGPRPTSGRDPDELLSAYLDDDLDADELGWLEARLAEEPALRARLQATHDVLTALRGLDRVSPPSGYEQRLRRRLAAARGSEPRADHARSQVDEAAAAGPGAEAVDDRAVVVPLRAAARRRRWTALAAAACVALIAAVGATVLPGAGPPVQPLAEPGPQAEAFRGSPPDARAPSDEQPAEADEERAFTDAPGFEAAPADPLPDDPAHAPGPAFEVGVEASLDSLTAVPFRLSVTDVGPVVAGLEAAHELAFERDGSASIVIDGLPDLTWRHEARAEQGTLRLGGPTCALPPEGTVECLDADPVVLDDRQPRATTRMTIWTRDLDPGVYAVEQALRWRSDDGRSGQATVRLRYMVEPSAGG